MIKKKLNNLLKSDLQAKIAKGVFWSFLGTFISRGFTFIAYILIANSIDIKAYGEIGILKSIIITFSLFSLASFGITATRYISIYKETDLSKVKRILSLTYYLTIGISLLMLLGIIFFSKSFSTELLGSENFKTETIIISFAIFFSALNGFQNGALGGFEKFKNISTVNIASGILAIPLLFVLTKFYGVVGFCIGISIQYFFLFLYSSFFLNKAMKENKISFITKNIFDEIKIIKKFSIPSFLGGFIISPTILICNTILVKSKGGFVSMGIYEAAFNFSIVAMTFNSMIGQVLYPYAVKMFDKKNQKFDFLNLNMPWIIGIFLGLFLIYLPDVFSLIFDEQYHNESMYRTVSCIAVFIIFISHRQGISRNLAAINKMWYGLLDNLIWAFLAVGFTFLLVDKGASGRAFAFVLAYLINSIIVLPLYINKKVFHKDFILSKESVGLWLLICVSFCTVLVDLNILIRLLLLISSLFLLVLISYKWYLRFLKTK
ncbi:oligosaccharide flippase family protein [Polaribacter haliotis]|uniref:Oligosaccharide flippase family protein n=1 Tax=Polaribacter haliotis TaxID=1888915 RepID=A0A7L8ACC2_9FLAO|nr:oligosaccharide flippase family protein [Polaribacter haliotis]QOD59678.1 oligosaccharide flippase family protein [Polaribacter haliotis]